MNPETLEILNLMQIPVWVCKKYLLIIDQTESLDANLMIKRLIKALHWDFESCMITEFDFDMDNCDQLIKAIEHSGIEKLILFGKNLSKIADLLGSHENLKIAVVPSVQTLMSDPMAKREAWGCLAPHFMNN